MIPGAAATTGAMACTIATVVARYPGLVWCSSTGRISDSTDASASTVTRNDGRPSMTSSQQSSLSAPSGRIVSVR